MENEFEKLNIDNFIINALNKENITTPTPIQEKSIPLLQEGYDVIGQAKTGTGKTFAYAIPLISKIDENTKYPLALVLTPTRELGIQVSKEIDKLLANTKKIKTACIYGGESYEKQRIALAKNPQIIIGTPGRIIDQMNRKNLDFSHIEYLVLDEADEMLKMGFQEDLDAILEQTPAENRTLLFSATMPNEVRRIASNYMSNPHEITIGKKNSGAVTVSHQAYIVSSKNRYIALKRIADLAKKYKDATIMIEGHAQKGTKNYFEVSQRRCDATRDYLISLGVEYGRMMTTAKGKDVLRYDEKQKDNRAKNDRVEISLVLP